MDKEAFKHKRSLTGNAYSGHGIMSGEDGSQTVAGIRGVYHYEGRLEESILRGGGEKVMYNYKEPFDPMVRTCKSNKKLVQ